MPLSKLKNEVDKMDFNKVIELVHSTKDLIFDDSLRAQITEKGLADYVTQVDLRIQEYLTRKLAEEFPDVVMMAEEGDDRVTVQGKKVWILDPIDGTTNLMRGMQHSAVSLALWDNDHMEFGVIYNPFLGETFTAYAGKGAFLNGTPIRVSESATLRDCLVMIGTCPYRKENAKVNFPLFEKIFMQVMDLRRSGTASLDLAYVACGRLDCFFELDLKPWDYAAGWLLVQEAGGSLTKWDGTIPDPAQNADLLVTNGKVHSLFLEQLKEVL